MKKVAIITFHGSHNYGSCLQAYALQKTINKFSDCECEIINFRTERQKDLYAVFTKRKGVKYLLKNASHLLRCRSLKKKYNLFEEFILNDLVLSKNSFSSLEQLMAENLDYDYYIAGSDQIWNPVPLDFDWAYFLPFVKGKPKIAYAPSFGPLISVGDSKTREKIKEYVNDFDYISVREEKAIEPLRKLTNKNIEVVLDPTMLLDKKEWLRLVEEKPIINKKYILLYTLFSNSHINKVAKIISQKLNMPVVVTNFSNQYDVFTSHKKKFATGPKEFLNLILNAQMVLVTSFHGTVFSILLNKRFLAIDGDKDARISNLLNIVGLEENVVNIENIDKKVEVCFNTNFENVNEKISVARDKSINYLKKALRIHNDGNL